MVEPKPSAFKTNKRCQSSHIICMSFMVLAHIRIPCWRKQNNCANH